VTSYPVSANHLSWWLVTFPRWKRLHAVPVAALDPHDIEATEELTSEPGPVLRAVCGYTGHMTMPGPFSRMGMPRCSHCCRKLGIAPGKGSPANEAARGAA
jgi:hypothetical protein